MGGGGGGSHAVCQGATGDDRGGAWERAEHTVSGNIAFCSVLLIKKGST